MPGHDHEPPEGEAQDVEVFRGRGRPTKYKPEYAQQARGLCAAGATDADLALHFEVAISTIYAWKSAFSEFSEAIKSEKSEADDRVEHSLYRRAVGYSQPAVRIFLPKGAPAPVYAEYVEAVAPDVTAAIFWLKNRRPEQWRDRINHELTGKNGGPVQTQEVSARDVLAGKLARLSVRSGAPEGSGGPDGDAGA